MRHAFACLTALTLLGAVAGPLEAQLVRGQVVDSITKAPLPEAAVVLLAASGEESNRTLTDEAGRFLFRPEAGEYQIRVEKEGYASSTFPPFSLEPQGMKGFMLLVPSLEPVEAPVAISQLVAEFCGDVLRPGQGVVLGLVRDNATGEPVGDARVVVSWGLFTDELEGLVRGADMGRVGGELVTDTSGFYAACAVPGETPITMHASQGDRLSDFLQIEFADGGVILAEDHHAGLTAWRHDFILVPPERRRAAVTGVVLDAETLQPMDGVTVEIARTGITTLTRGGGVFRLNQLPAGPAQLQVKRPGFRPLSRDIELTPDEMVTLPPGAFLMAAAPTDLEPVVVAADAARGRRPLADFYERRDKGIGSFITRDEWENRGTPEVPTDVLRGMRGIRVRPNAYYSSLGGPQWIISMSRGEQRSFSGREADCPPLLFLDRQLLGNAMSMDIDQILPLVNIEAIEAYQGITVPQEFMRRGAACGVIAFWTR